MRGAVSRRVDGVQIHPPTVPARDSRSASGATGPRDLLHADARLHVVVSVSRRRCSARPRGTWLPLYETPRGR